MIIPQFYQGDILLLDNLLQFVDEHSCHLFVLTLRLTVKPLLLPVIKHIGLAVLIVRLHFSVVCKTGIATEDITASWSHTQCRTIVCRHRAPFFFWNGHTLVPRLYLVIDKGDDGLSFSVYYSRLVVLPCYREPFRIEVQRKAIDSRYCNTLCCHVKQTVSAVLPEPHILNV